MKQQIQTLPWPANSPDLSPIENLWGHMWRLAMDTRPREKEELLAAVNTVFYSQLTAAYIESLVLSFRRRLIKCVELNGSCVNVRY